MIKWNIELSDEEIKFLKLNKMYNIHDSLDLEDALADYIQLNCIDEKDNVIGDGLICESILDKLGEIE